jgi:hypothetical protein
VAQSPAPGPRLFTVEEANALVPLLEERLERFRRSGEELQAARDELSVFRLVASSGSSEDNPDQKSLEKLERRARRLAAAMARIQHEILAAGCAPKSFANGLIDFFALKGDRLVFLCWKLGEAEVSHWHALEGGYAGRRPIGTFLDDAPPDRAERG